VKEQLESVLRPVLGDGVVVENLNTLTGGASRTTWAFDAVAGRDRRALILRTGPPDDVHAGMELEALVQQRAAAAGAPVPHILAADNSPAALGNPYLICDAIGGETIVRRIHRALDEAARDRLLHQCAQALAAIHRADPDGVGMTQADPLSEWRERLDEMGDTTATFEWAFRWLAAHRPPPSRPRGVPVVADAGHPALGGHLPLPGRTAPVRAEPVGGTCGDRTARQRNRMGRAGSAQRRAGALGALPTQAGGPPA
jgi:aminoglycoside phosphotransferase (APT) family kinase protein